MPAGRHPGEKNLFLPAVAQTTSSSWHTLASLFRAATGTPRGTIHFLRECLSSPRAPSAPLSALGSSAFCASAELSRPQVHTSPPARNPAASFPARDSPLNETPPTPLPPCGRCAARGFFWAKARVLLGVRAQLAVGVRADSAAFGFRAGREGFAGGSFASRLQWMIVVSEFSTGNG